MVPENLRLGLWNICVIAKLNCSQWVKDPRVLSFNPLTTAPEISQAGVHGECVLKQNQTVVNRLRQVCTLKKLCVKFHQENVVLGATQAGLNFPRSW